jgi:hypothetical protein
MRDCEGYVPTKAVGAAVEGREAAVLNALGIEWNGKARHILCPYPDHPDHQPSWRWDEKRKLAFCTCIGTRPGEKKAHSIFGVVCAKEKIDRDAAKIRIAQIIGRPELTIRGKGQKYQRTDAATLLSPPPENRDDALCWAYLGHRLGIEPENVPPAATQVVGIKALAYHDPPQRGFPPQFSRLSIARAINTRIVSTSHRAVQAKQSWESRPTARGAGKKSWQKKQKMTTPPAGL